MIKKKMKIINELKNNSILNKVDQKDIEEFKKKYDNEFFLWIL